MTGLLYEQVLELVDRVEDYLGGWHPQRGRRREMEMFDAVVATLFYYRHSPRRPWWEARSGLKIGPGCPLTSLLLDPCEVVA
jgi:hypothetical protein